MPFAETTLLTGGPKKMLWESVGYLGIGNPSLRSMLSGKGYYYYYYHHRSTVQASPEYQSKKDRKNGECDYDARTTRRTATLQDAQDVEHCSGGNLGS